VSLGVDKPGFTLLGGDYRSVYGRGNSQISFREAAANFLYIFDMSANMARQGVWVQLEQSGMHLALNIAKMAKGGFWWAGMLESNT